MEELGLQKAEQEIERSRGGCHVGTIEETRGKETNPS